MTRHPIVAAMPRALLACLAVALVARGLAIARTPIPDRDAAHYLWMAERFRDGDVTALFATVFHPLYALLTGLVLRALPSADPLLVGQCVSGLASAAATVPLWWIGRRLFGAPAATFGALFFAIGVWFARHPADAMSEGPFHLFVATAVALLVAPTPRACAAAGVVVGLAYGTRPEALSLFAVATLHLFVARAPGRVVFAAVGAAALLVTPLCYAAFGPGFTWTPKASFNVDVGVGAADAGGVAHYLTHLVRVPGTVFEAVGFVAVPLAIVGALHLRSVVPRGARLAHPSILLLAPFAIQCLVVPLLRNHVRFLSGYGLLVLPLAGLGLVVLRQRLPQLQSRATLAAFLVVATAGDWIRLPRERRADRIVERALGVHFRTLLAPGERIATEMPRLEYFAGLEPGPPRPISSDEILATADDPATKFVVLVRARTPAAADALPDRGYHEATLPPNLARLAAERGIVVFARE